MEAKKTRLILYQGFLLRRRELLRLDQYGKVGGYNSDWGLVKSAGISIQFNVRNRIMTP